MAASSRKEVMTTPAWMPPQLPEVVAPEPDSPRQRIAFVGLGIGCLLAFGLGAAGWKFRSSVDAAPNDSRPIEIVDSVLDDMVSSRWDAAFDAFSPDCADFGLEALRGGFEPVLSTYESHDLNPLRRSDFDPEEIVLVFGEMDLGNQRPNSLRAEFVFAGSETERPWKLCGLRIDGP